MKKKLGIGSLSLLLVALALLWSCNIALYDNFCLGDYLLGLVNLPSWSNGTSGMHYTVWYSLVLLIPAFILGKKYENHLFYRVRKVDLRCHWWLSSLAIVYVSVVVKEPL